VHCPSRGVDSPEGAKLCTERRGLAERRAAPTEAEALLAVGSVSHKSLSFEREVIETARHRPDDAIVERGRVLAACGRDAIGAAMAGEPTGLCAESRNIGSRVVLPSLGAALTGEQPGLASA
jgi:hypothetical protein